MKPSVAKASIASVKMRSYESISTNMSTNLKLELKPEAEAHLAEGARMRGVSLEDYIRDVLEEHAANGEAKFSKSATLEEWEAALDDFIHSTAFQNISWKVDDSGEVSNVQAY